VSSAIRLIGKSPKSGKGGYVTLAIMGSALSWQDVNLLGEYDFSEEPLQDRVGKLQNWLTKQAPIFGSRRITESSSSIEGSEKSCENFGTFVGI
jgi:hypothetical protein